MTALALGAAWAALPLVIVAGRRPPARVPRGHVVVSHGRRCDPLAALGQLLVGVARAARLTPPGVTPDDTARRLALVALAVAAAAVTAPLLAPVVAAAPRLVGLIRRRRHERRHLHSVQAGLPEVVDLLALAVAAGANIRLAVAAAGRRGAGPLGAELRRVAAEADAGRRLADALEDLPARAGEGVRALAAVLAGCERYGAPVVPALERLAAEVRRQRLRRAEAAARRVPVLLLFPLVLCILPAFALLTVAPLIAGALRELRL